MNVDADLRTLEAKSMLFNVNHRLQTSDLGEIIEIYVPRD